MKRKHQTILNFVPVEVTYEVDSFGNVEIHQVRRLNKPADDDVWDVISEADGNELAMAVESAYLKECTKRATDLAISRFESALEAA